MSNKKLLLLVFILLPIIIAGSFLHSARRLNKEYGYLKSEQVVSKNKIGAKLIGSWSYVEKQKLNSMGSPYELFLWIDTEPNHGNSVIISELVLFSEENSDKEVILKRNDITQKLQSYPDKNSTAYFSFEDLSLDYKLYSLKIHFKIMNENTVISENSVLLYFEKDYKEYSSNAFWDAVSGV